MLWFAIGLVSGVLMGLLVVTFLSVGKKGE